MSKTVVHNFRVRFPPTQLRVQDDQPNRPIRNGCQGDEEEDTHDESSSGHGVGKTYNSSSQDGVCHLPQSVSFPLEPNTSSRAEGQVMML